MPRLARLGFFFLVGLAGWRLAGAQTPCPPLPIVHAQPFVLCQVDQPPVLRSASGPLEYPGLLRAARFAGSARVRLVIDSAGFVAPPTVESLAASHGLFYDAARRSLVASRFEPARRGSQPVPVTIEIEIEYMIAPVDSVPVRRIQSVVRAPWGLRITTGWEAIPLAVPPAVLGRDDAREVQVAILDALVPPVGKDSGRVTCIRLGAGSAFSVADPAFIDRMRARTPSIATGNDCPPTYQSMIPRVRPPGAVDPDIVQIGLLTAWTADVVMAQVRTGRGSGGSVYLCQVDRLNATAKWTASCTNVAGWMT